MLENLKKAILQERLAVKVAEVENLKARVEALSITLAETESALKENQEFATILSEKEEALSILLQKKYTRPEAEGVDNMEHEASESRKQTIALVEKELDSILLEKQDLKAINDLLSKSLAEMETALNESLAPKKKELDTFRLEKEELKARVDLLSKSLAEVEAALSQSLADKEKQETQNEELKARVEVLSNLLQYNYNNLKEGRKFFMPEGSLGHNQILPLNGKSMPSTSATLQQREDVKKLAFSFENLATPSHQGTKKLSDLSFLGNIFPTEAISREDGTKETTSTSVESVPSTKKVPDEAFVLHEFPFLNMPPPDSPRMLSKRPILCEECNKQHVPYYYCFNQPCSACYSKDHHFIKCPYLRYIPKGVDFNRDVYEVGCNCGNLFDEEEWLCSLCPEGTKSTILKAKICYFCKRIGEHCAWECPEYKDKAARYRSFRDEEFARSKARKAESLAKSSQSPSPNSLEDPHDRLVFYKS